MRPPPSKHETLDDLFARAEHYAEFNMRNVGRLHPAIFLLGENGLEMVLPEHLKDEQAKDDFAMQARLTCIAHAATVAVMALEAWATFAKPDQPLDLSTPPSEAFDRREFVVLMGESRTGCQQRMLPIIRTGAGGFFGFGETESPGAEEMSGRFAQILSPHPPSDQQRAAAKALLAIKAARRAAADPTQPRPRTPRF
jgi:hypothetical protein